jgi:uncharacterized protein YceK
MKQMKNIVHKCSTLMIGLNMLIACTLNGCSTINSQIEIHDARQSNNQIALCDSRRYLDTSIIYSGSYNDVHNFILLPFTCHGEGCFGMFIYPVVLIGGLISLPIDFAADTLILPYTIYISSSLDCDKSNSAKQY